MTANVRVCLLLVFLLFGHLSLAWSDESDRLYEKATKALNLDQLQQAEALAEQLMAQPQNAQSTAEAFFVLGQIYERTYPEKALGFYQKYLDRKPFSVHQQEARFKISIIHDALRQKNLEILPYYLNALRFRDRGLYDQAIAQCLVIVSQFPNNRLADDAFHLMAYMQLIDLSDFQLALKTYREFLNAFPSSNYFDNALYGYGLAQEGLGNFQQARETYNSLCDRHTAIDLPFGLGRVPKDTYLDRVWFVKANNRLNRIDQREVALQTSSLNQNIPPFVIGIGSRFNIDQPVGSGQSYRNLWHLVKENGIQVTHLTHWITRYTDWHWESKQTLMACLHAGYTPVISFWYFGDAISPEYVEQNKQAYWQTIQDHLIPLIKDLPNVVILLEPEFNKNGIVEWDGWDLVASQAIKLIRQGAPRAKVGLTFGDWGDSEVHDPTKRVKNAAQLSDFIGFIEMTSSYDHSTTFDPSWSLTERIGRFADHLHKAFNKPLYLGYMAISTANNWEEKQGRLIQHFFNNIPYYQTLGVTGAAFFALFDNPNHVGWFSEGEQHFGLLSATGNPKVSADFWKKNVQILREKDQTTPSLTTPLKGLSPNPIDLNRPLICEAEFSEWCQWRIEIKGDRSGALWQTYGAGSDMYFSWEGQANTGAFVQEPITITLYAQDSAGHSLSAPAQWQGGIRFIPAQNIFPTTSLSLKESQTWGLDTRTKTEPEGRSFHFNRIPAGVRLPFARVQDLALSNLQVQGYIQTTMALLRDAGGLLIGLEDVKGFRSEHLLEAYLQPQIEMGRMQELRIPFADFSKQGIRYNAQGIPEWQPLDFRHIAAITFTATSSLNALQIHQIDIVKIRPL